MPNLSLGSRLNRLDAARRLFEHGGVAVRLAARRQQREGCHGGDAGRAHRASESHADHDRRGEDEKVGAGSAARAGDGRAASR